VHNLYHFDTFEHREIGQTPVTSTATYVALPDDMSTSPLAQGHSPNFLSNSPATSPRPDAASLVRPASIRESQSPSESIPLPVPPPNLDPWPKQIDGQSESPSMLITDPTFSVDEATQRPRPPFQPFFTLISDAGTSATYHPREINYLFSDDDHEVLTSTLLSTLSSSSTAASEITQKNTTKSKRSNKKTRPNRTGKGKGREKESTGSSQASNMQSGEQSGLGSGQEQRVLLLDLDDSGMEIKKACSLSPNWQILETSLRAAPTWEGTGDGDDAGMMLRIEGTDGGFERSQDQKKMDKGKGIADSNERESVGTVVDERSGMAEVDFQALMVEFDDRMKLLRTVVEVGGYERIDHEDAVSDGGEVEEHQEVNVESPALETA